MTFKKEYDTLTRVHFVPNELFPKSTDFDESHLVCNLLNLRDRIVYISINALEGVK